MDPSGALREIVGRVHLLGSSADIASSLLPPDRDGLQIAVQEAWQALANAAADPSFADASLAACCKLACCCVSVAGCAELSTSIIRLVSTGCELLATLLRPGQNGSLDQQSCVEQALGELAEQVDSLALEVYCGLGRQDVGDQEIPLTSYTELIDFHSLWGSAEHRLALEELSTWLLCVVFRAIGSASVRAEDLLDFTNRDLLCLGSLLRGLLVGRPNTGLSEDLEELQQAALAAFSRLTAPELAFAADAGVSDASVSIEERNQTLAIYFDGLCGALVETGLLEVCLQPAITAVRRLEQLETGTGATFGTRLLAFFATLLSRAELAQATLEDPWPAPLRLRAELVRHVDALGNLLDAMMETHAKPISGFELRALVSSCVEITDGIATVSERRGWAVDDGFTFACRALLSDCLADGVGGGPEGAQLLAALAALAANVGDLEVVKDQIAALAGQMAPTDAGQAKARLLRTGSQRLAIHKDQRPHVLMLFNSAADAPLEEVPMPPKAPSAEAATTAEGRGRKRLLSKEPPLGQQSLRDKVTDAPKELRCRLDGKLLCDPVVSPQGFCFERSSLARWIRHEGERCPLTGVALRLEDCERSLEIRKQVTQWIRGEGRRREIS